LERLLELHKLPGHCREAFNGEAVGIYKALLVYCICAGVAGINLCLPKHTRRPEQDFDKFVVAYDFTCTCAGLNETSAVVANHREKYAGDTGHMHTTCIASPRPLKLEDSLKIFRELLLVNAKSKAYSAVIPKTLKLAALSASHVRTDWH
jgi:hypothetical protein